MKPIKFGLSFLFLLLAYKSFIAESKCSKTCDLALASYYISYGTNLTYVSKIMQSKVLSKREVIVNYNTDTVPNSDLVIVSTRVNVPFPCDCINDEFLAHTFLYEVQHGDNYDSIAKLTFSNLTTGEFMERVNIYTTNTIPEFAKVNVTVNCSCGSREVSKDYGLFITYPLNSEDTLESIAKDTDLDAEVQPWCEFQPRVRSCFYSGERLDMS